MTPADLIQVVLFFAVALAIARPLGTYIARVYRGERTFLQPVLGPLETGVYRLTGIDPGEEMSWTAYARNMLLFSLVGIIGLYALLRWQGRLPLNPQGLPGVSPDLAFNTAISFVTNTNWQAYAGETTVSNLSQMLGLAVQNFLSAAVGLAVAVALVRGFVRRESSTIGNFWVDLTRSVVHILLPLSLALAVILLSQGVVQSFRGEMTVPWVDPAVSGQSTRSGVTGPAGGQTIPSGPVASQEAIKEVGTNGGGFYNANSAHPFENPTPLTNFLEMLGLVAIPLALPFAFGVAVGDRRQGQTLVAAVMVILLLAVSLSVAAEVRGDPLWAHGGVAANMEGKEVRFGPVNSALFATLTTGTACGAVNSSHDSLTPLGGLVPLALMQLGEVAPGGVGSGLYALLVFVLLAVFVAGLMVGRTPEYLGKKIEPNEMKMAALYFLLMPVLVLVLTAAALIPPAGLEGIANAGPHGFSEVLYAFTSAVNNNGSAFGGLGAGSTFYNTALGLAMLAGRFWMAVPILAIAGSLARKKATPASAGTMPTTGVLFLAWLLAVIFIAGALNFVPALSLGPVIEHILMLQGRVF